MRDDMLNGGDEESASTRKSSFNKSNGFDAISQFLQENFEISEPAETPVVTNIQEPDSQPVVAEPTNEDALEPEVNQVTPIAPVEVGKGPSMTEPSTQGSNNSFDDLSVEDLKKQQEEIDRKIQEKQKAEKQAVIDQIVHVVETYKIPIEELVEALGGIKVKRKGVKATPKYRDPASGAIWTGRGKEPVWIRDKDRTKFLIK